MSDLDSPRATAQGLGRPTRVRYRVLAAACALAVVTYLHRVGFATASKEFKDPLGLNDQHLGWVMAAFMVAYGLFEIPWGILGDRWGVRGPLTLVMLGGSLTTALVALLGVYPGGLFGTLVDLLALRFLFGMFQAGTFPAVSRMLADWMPVTERGSAQGLIWMSSRAGGMLAPLLLGPLFVALDDWRSPLVVAAGIGLAWCAGFLPWFRNRPEESASVNAAERARILAGRAAKERVGHAAVPWRRMAGSRSVWALCLMYGCLGYSGNFFLTLLPTYLKEHRGISSVTTDRITSLPFACGILACLVGGALSDVIIRRQGSRKWGRRAVGATGMMIAALAIVSVPWVRSTWLLALLLSLTFLANDLAMGPAWAAAADIGERFAGTLSGAMNMTASLTGALAAVLTGALFHRGYVILPFQLFALSYVIGVACWLEVDTTKTLTESHDELEA